MSELPTFTFLVEYQAVNFLVDVQAKDQATALEGLEDFIKNDMDGVRPLAISVLSIKELQ